MNALMSGHNIKIVGIEPQNKKGWKDVHFTVDDDPDPYEFCYSVNNPKESWFSDTPDIVEHSHDKIAIDFLVKLIKSYEIKNQLSPSALKTFNELIDEL